MLLPGQERLHFSHENRARRRQILDVIQSFHLLVDLYRADTESLPDRRRCLEAIVRDTAATAERLVIERDESVMDHDRDVLRAATRRHGCHETLRWDLFVPKADPLLWVPDAVVWSWVRGGEWRHAVQAFCQLREL
ncbi:hypothetical protein ACWCOV_20140 [Kribbella sp. NPDC002412]